MATGYLRLTQAGLDARFTVLIKDNDRSQPLPRLCCPPNTPRGEAHPKKAVAGLCGPITRNALPAAGNVAKVNPTAFCY